MDSVLWIRIRNGSVFSSFMDPDRYSEYESTHDTVVDPDLDLY